ncbi:LamG-like jellyroll fold domain-containing protein [Streptomyces sp. NPDC002853]
MAVLTGTEQAALAVDRLAAGPNRAAPEQRWGSAVGRSHSAPAKSTDAVAKGGHDGPQRGRGELPADSGSGVVRLGGAPKLPKPGPVNKTHAPAVPVAQGFTAKHSKELKAKRKERQRTFQNPDGTYTTRYYTEPVNFRAKDGSWKTIDTTLVHQDDSGPQTMSDSEPGWETESTESPVSFAGTADADPLVRMGLGNGLSVGYAVDDASAVAGRVAGSIVTYPEVRDGSDLELVAGGSSVKETVVLKDKDAPTEWRFPLELQGLTAKDDGDGGIAFTDSDGTQHAWMPPGWMQDSAFANGSREGTVSSGVTYSLTEENGRQVVVMKLDEDWLTAPERVFPVRVDPSVKSFGATSGTYVEYPYNQNFASDTVLKAGTYDGGSHKAAAFLRFTGMESTLKNAWVLNANLALYNTWSQSCTARPVTVHPVTSNWSESTTDKYPGPSTGSSLASKSFAHGWRPAGTETWACGAAWESIKLGSAGRKLVDDWTHGRKKNYGLAVKASTSDSKGWKQFGSDDYPNGKPSLDVTWTKYGASYKLGDFTAPVTATSHGVEKVTVTNRGQETWPKGGDYKLRYNLFSSAGKEITDSSKIAYTEMPETVSPGESVTLDAKIAPLVPATYTVQWTMTEYGVSRFTSAGVPGPAVKIASVNIPPQLTAESPGSGITADSLTPTLWAKGTDEDSYPKTELQYTFEVCEVEGSSLRKNCRKGARSAEQQWAVPDGWLLWGKTYAWYAYVYDGDATSARPGAALLTTQVPQPTVTGHLGGADGGKEIGTRAGNYVTAATDAALTTVGPELSVARTYNSLDPRSGGAFGTGWSTRWDMKVREEPDTSTVLVTLADGSQVRFGRNAGGTYTGPSAGAFSLGREVEGWVLRERSGATYHFMPSGVLAQVKDAAGRIQSVTRQAEDGGPVKKVTDRTSGRSLSFTWSGGHVDSVTTSPVDANTPGLTWRYTYDGDRLTKVCPPSSDTECTVYEYGDGSVYRSGVLDAAPSSYWRLGESEGAAAASEAASHTGLNEALYRDVQLGGGSAIAGTTDASAGFNGTDSTVELPAGTLKAAAYPTIELWFKTNTPSGVLVGFQDAELGDKPTSYRPVLNIDPSGKLRGEFRRIGGTGASGPITSASAVTDNAWHHAVLSASAAGQTLYLDGKKVGSIDGAVSDQSRDYAYLGAGYASASWMGAATGEYRFTGQMDEVAVYGHSVDAATVAEHYAARVATGQVKKVTLPSGRVHATATYDPASGRLTQHTDDNGGSWKVSAPSYSTSSSSYANTIQRSGPTGYWRLGERSGAQASSPLGEGLDGSYLDGVRLGSAGIFSDGDDTAASFTGDGAAEVPSETLGTGTAMSVELWFKTTDPGVLVTNQNAEFGDTPTGWRPMLLIDSDGKLRGKFTSGATSILSNESVTDNKWHHVVLTGNEGVQALFLDGAYQGRSNSGVETLRHPHVFIGGGYTSTGWDSQESGYRNFTGQIDEVAFYDKPLVQFTKIGDSWTYVPGRTSLPGYTDTPNRHVQARTSLVKGTGEQYQGVAVADAPAAYWRLGESEGTALRSEVGGPGTNATFQRDQGTVFQSTLDATGVFGPGDNRAAHLGSSGHITLPGSTLAGASDVSVEMWFRTSSHSAVLMGLQDAKIGETPTSYRPVLNIDGAGKLRGEFRQQGATGAQGPITSSQAVTDGAWHHVVLSGDSKGQALYLDGARIGSITGPISDQSRPYAYVGGGYANAGWMDQPADTYYLRGDVDEVALYRGALSAEQVSAHYRAGAEGVDSGLTATVRVTDPKQKTSSTSYDALHGQRTVSRTDATGAVTGYAYDNGGNLHTVTDPNGHATVTGHDARGNVVSTTTCRDANSCWTDFRSYYLNPNDPLDPRNDKPLTYRDQRSSDYKDARYRTEHSYNAQGLLTSTVRPDNSTAATTYTTGEESAVGSGLTPAGLVASQTTPGGAVTKNRYFANGDLAEVTSPSGLLTKYSYDGLGRKASETQVSDTFPAGVSTTYGYDTASHVVTETGAGVENEITKTTHTAKITRTFDEDGRLLTESTKDTTGGDTERSTVYHYNQDGLNDSITDAEQNTTRLEHDELGRVSGKTDAAGAHFTYTYTARGQHSSTILNDWTGHPSGSPRDLVMVSNAYDPAGRLASTTDAMGATTAYTYFDDGLAATTTAKQVTQSAGAKHDIELESNTYDAAGNLTRQVTGGGATTQTFAVDPLGRTTHSVLDPGGLDRATTVEYDGDDRVNKQTQSISGDRKLTSTSEYDPAGNPKKQTITDGSSTHTTTHTYDKRGLLLTSVSPRGNDTGAVPQAHTTSYRYDALGRLVQHTSPEVRTEEKGAAATAARPVARTGYNAFGEATETKDPRGHVTRTEVDRLGRTAAVTLPDYTPPSGGAKITATTRTTYTPLGLPQTTVDPLGRTTRYGYDQLGQQTSKTDPVPDAATAAAQKDATPQLLLGPASGVDGGGVTRYGWTPTGLQLSTTDPTGARTEATYDELGRQLTATTVERHPTVQNLTTRLGWDDASRQTSSTTPVGRTTTTDHNPAGDVISVADPAGTTKFGYDGLGRRTETTDATQRRSTVSYDALGNVTGTADYGTTTTALRSTSAEFDADGNQTSATTATKARTTYAYDALGRMTEQVEPVSATKTITTAFGYDAAGNRTRLTDGRHNSTTYTFNAWGLPESTVEPATDAHPDAADRTWTTSYNKVGLDVTQTLPGGAKRERAYDGLDRLTHETGSGAEVATADRILTYDLAGRLTGTGGVLDQNTYTYNDRGQLLTAKGPSGAASYTYDADGNMTHRTTAAGDSDYGYDSAGRLDWAWDELTGNDIWYDFDAAGRPELERYTTKPEGSASRAESARRTYKYDGLGRLKSDKVTLPDGTGTITSNTYDYDVNNRLTLKNTTGTAGAGDNSYAYDDAGRMTSWTHDGSTTDYVWDAAGNRTKAGAISADFDARNRQLTEDTSAFTYTPRGTLASVNDGSGTPRKLDFDAFERKITDGGATYTYDALDRVQTRGQTAFTYDGGSNNLATDGTSAYSRTPDGTLLSSSTGTTKQWALTDQHTDLVAGLTPDGKQVSSSTAYDPFGTETVTDGTTPAVGYQSGWTDPDTGDVNMASRWYQPGTGSFEARDTWLLEAQPSVRGNRYTYGHASPLNGIDPTGHDAWDVVGWGISVASRSAGGVFWNTWTMGHDSIGSSDCTSRYGVDCSQWFQLNSGLRDSISGTRQWMQNQLHYAGGRSSLQYTGPGGGYGYSYGGGYYFTGGGARYAGNGTYIRPTKPPKPPIDQNPNNGPHARPAPTRPPAKAVWTAATWTTGQGVSATVTAQAMVNLAAVALFTPSVVPGDQVHPAPADNPGGKNNGRTRNDKKCDVGPGVSATGHAVYLPRERYFDTFENRSECRATGAYGLLDGSDYNKGRAGAGTNTNVSTQPPGMREIDSQRETAANGHLIPAATSGSGIDLRNLVAQYQKTNHPYLSYGVEKDIRKAVTSGKHVAVSIVPHYGNSGSGIPTKIEYDYSVLEDRTRKHCVIRQTPSGGVTTGSATCPTR